MIREKRNLKFEDSVSRLIKKLGISREYRDILLNFVDSKKYQNELIAYTDKGNISFRTLPGFVKRIFDEYIENVNYLTALENDIKGRDRRDNNKKTSRAIRLRFQIFPRDSLGYSVKMFPKKYWCKGTYSLMERWSRKRKNPDCHE